MRWKKYTPRPSDIKARKSLCRALIGFSTKRNKPRKCKSHYYKHNQVPQYIRDFGDLFPVSWILEKFGCAE